MERPVRSKQVRLADTIATLERLNHLWIATSSPQAPQAHLVPLSFAWTGSRLIIATGTYVRTGANLRATGRARVAMGRTDDVVLMDVTVEKAIPVEEAAPDMAALYAAQSDWDPQAGAEVPTSYFVLTPTRVQAWRDNNELPGRTLMAHGEWLVEGADG